jgi:Tol biopolymer transport system component
VRKATALLYLSTGISEDGTRIVFSSNASTIAPGDHNGTFDVIVRDLRTGSTQLASISSEGIQGNGPSLHAVISGNGRFVAFHSFADNLVSGDTNNVPDVFVRDLEARTTRRVSADPLRGQPNAGADRAAISHDGRVMAFSSLATNLTDTATDGKEHVFVVDLKNGTTTQASVSDDDVKERLLPCLFNMLCRRHC